MDVTAEEILKRWGASIRSRRDDLDMSQEDLAAAVGCTQQTISRIEIGQNVGQKGIPLKLGLKIAAALAVRYDDLFAVGEGVA